jgi:hypothetical protein
MTRKEFRQLLNERFPFKADEPGKGDKGRYKATKRAYGDYLWFQDREMFENDYQEHIEKTKGSAA